MRFELAADAGKPGAALLTEWSAVLALVFPGATAETSAAMPAVRAVAAPSTSRRVRLTRISAASRSTCAAERTPRTCNSEADSRTMIVS